MLELVQFENGRYGLRNTVTGIIVDREWRTVYFANRSRNKQLTKLGRVFGRLTRKNGKV